MPEQEKWIDRLNKLISITDKASEGLNFIKDIIDDSEEEPPHIPYVPNAAEVVEMYKELDDDDVDAAIGLEIYHKMAKSMSAYCKYLVELLEEENEDVDAQEAIHKNMLYATDILVDMANLLRPVKKVKYKNNKKTNLLVRRFDFVNRLIGDADSLSETYPLPFLKDVSEILEVVVELVDTIDELNGREAFSGCIISYHEKIAAVDSIVTDIMNIEHRKRVQTKVMKKYIKFVRKYAKKLANKFGEEAYILMRECRRR